MERLSPSSNNPYPTVDPRRQQDEDEDDNNDDNDQHDHENDVAGQRISRTDYVDVKIRKSVGVVPSLQSPVSTSSEIYPSWLSKAPFHLPPQV